MGVTRLDQAFAAHRPGTQEQGDSAKMNDAMKRALMRAAGTIVMSAWGATAHAQVTPAAGGTPPDDTPSIRGGTVIYTDFTYQAEPKVNDADKKRDKQQSITV